MTGEDAAPQREVDDSSTEWSCRAGTSDRPAVDGTSTETRRVADPVEVDEPSTGAGSTADADSGDLADAYADELADAEEDPDASGPASAGGEAAGARLRAGVASVLGRVLGARADGGADGSAGPDARASASTDPLAWPDADTRANWRERTDGHYAAAREHARTCWRAWVRAWTFVLVVAWALDPRTRFPAPADSDPPDWAFALAPYVVALAAWARAELRPGPLFARWLGWVEDRQNRFLAAAGGAGTLVAYVLAAVGNWPLDGLLGALALWVLSLLYVPAGVALALKQYRGEFDRGWTDLPDHSPEVEEDADR